MGASKKLKKGRDSSRLVLKESGSTSRAADPSDSISECLIDVVSLPQELITEILVFLPVKSLLRFKCVSKPWLSLISNPQFIRSHFSKSSSREADSLNLHVLFATKTSLKKCCLYSLLHEADPCIHLSVIEYPAENRFFIVGIINGLVCLNLKENDFCVWNPALNKTKHLNVHPVAPSGPRRVEYSYSFGYDESHDDYKVVCFQTTLGNDGVYYVEVRIYSLKADSWRRIDQLKGFNLPYHGVFYNGKIYWSDHLLAPPNWKIVSLDMSSEKFVELQHPEYDAPESDFKMVVSGGRLFVLCDFYNANKVDLWVLDKHGAEECWCKLVSIVKNDVNPRISMFHYRVLCIFSNGDIVFGYVDGLQVYNYKKKESRGIEMAVGIPTSWRIAAYVESLVWPNNA